MGRVVSSHERETSRRLSKRDDHAQDDDRRIVPGPGDNAWLALDGIVFPAP
jgi:hypothetical protein